MVVRRDIATGVPVQGTLRPLADVNLLAPFPDVIEEVLVKEGQAVQRGQVLARMRMTSVTPAAASAEAQRRIAAADCRRMQNLLKEGAVAERDVENAEAQLKAAEAAAAVGRKRLDEATVRAPFAGVVAERFLQSGDRVGDGDPPVPRRQHRRARVHGQRDHRGAGPAQAGRPRGADGERARRPPGLRPRVPRQRHGGSRRRGR